MYVPRPMVWTEWRELIPTNLKSADLIKKA